jgi:hypothetical protein
MARRSLLTMSAHVLVDLPEQVGTEVAKRRVQLGTAAGADRKSRGHRHTTRPAAAIIAAWRESAAKIPRRLAARLGPAEALSRVGW